MTLKIGNLAFSTNLIQGPLAGYSCAPFRKLFSAFTPPAYCVTEMISAQDLIKRRDKKSRYLWRDPQETILCYQLAGNCPQILSEAVLIAMDAGADMIDLNCGCPKPKIRKKKLGSYLLSDPQNLANIVEQMKLASTVPITVKIRLDITDANNLILVKALERAGADAIIVHGRHWQEDYQIPCRYERIAEIVAAVNIPIIGNGDVRDYASLQTMLTKTQCAGIMISRGGTGKPWLYQQLQHELSENLYNTPSLTVIKQVFFQHVHGLAQLENEYAALLQARKLLKYYFKDHLNSNNLLSFYNINNLKDLSIWLEKPGILFSCN